MALLVGLFGVFRSLQGNSAHGCPLHGGKWRKNKNADIVLAERAGFDHDSIRTIAGQGSTKLAAEQLPRGNSAHCRTGSCFRSSESGVVRAGTGVLKNAVYIRSNLDAEVALRVRVTLAYGRA